MKTIWGHFKNSNETRNYKKQNTPSLFFVLFSCIKLRLACLNVFTNKLNMTSIISLLPHYITLIKACVNETSTFNEFN